MSKDKDPMEWEVLESEYLYKRPWLTAKCELYEETGYAGGEWSHFMVSFL